MSHMCIITLYRQPFSKLSFRLNPCSGYSVSLFLRAASLTHDHQHSLNFQISFFIHIFLTYRIMFFFFYCDCV